MGAALSQIAVRETEPGLNAKMGHVAESYRRVGRAMAACLRRMERVADNAVGLHEKVIPDLRATIHRYASAKHKYLVFCMKVRDCARARVRCRERVCC